MAKKLFATTLVAKDVTFNAEEFEWSNFKVINTSVKRYSDDEEPVKIKVPTKADLEDKAVRVFAMLDIDNAEANLVKDMAVLNKHGFLDVIDMAADGSFKIKDGAQIRNIGDTLEFRVA